LTINVTKRPAAACPPDSAGGSTADRDVDFGRSRPRRNVCAGASTRTAMSVRHDVGQDLADAEIDLSTSM
jgi:hypothetical protein